MIPDTDISLGGGGYTKNVYFTIPLKKCSKLLNMLMLLVLTVVYMILRGEDQFSRYDKNLFSIFKVSVVAYSAETRSCVGIL
jgi:hypothetical protein